MKVFAFLFVVTFAVGQLNAVDPKSWQEDVDKWMETCTTKLKISAEDVKKLKSMERPPIDEPGTCFAACILEEAGFMGNDKLDKDKVHEFLEEMKDMEEAEDVEKIIKECYEEAVAKSNKCEIAGTLANCMYDKKEAQNAEA